MKGRVLVIPRPETPDSEGESLAKALEDGGMDGVVSVRQGKIFEIEVSTTDPALARAQLTKMASEHLANPATERVEVLVPGAGPEAYGVVAVYDRRQAERRAEQRRADADRRSGRDRRIDELHAQALEDNAKGIRDSAKRPEGNRRTGSDRREVGERREESDRRELNDRRTGMERRSGGERRIDDEDFSGPERRSWIRRRRDQ